MLASCWDFACLFVVLTSSIHDINTWHQWWINTWHQYIMTSIWWIWLRCINCLQALGCSFNLRPFTDEHGSPNAGRPSPVDRGRLSSLGAPNAAYYGCHWIWRRWKKRSFKVATSGSTAVCLTISTSAFPRTPVNHSECFARCCWPQKCVWTSFWKKMSGKYESCCWARASTWFEGRKESALVLLKISI